MMTQKLGLGNLPGEILLHIISFLDPIHITALQLVCQSLRQACRDNHFWRAKCLDDSTFLASLHLRLRLRRHQPIVTHCHRSRGHDPESPGDGDCGGVTAAHRSRARLLSNWDPSLPGERVDWYDEYIQRHAPIAINWFQRPRAVPPNLVRDGDGNEALEAHGLALYRPANDPSIVLAVSPLEDGSICLWDVSSSPSHRGCHHRPGSIFARSRPSILFEDGPGAVGNQTRCKRLDSSVTEAISVDEAAGKAFVAIQSHLVEVDLATLSVSGRQSFPSSITALSAVANDVPLTVGTRRGIHLYDYRMKALALGWKEEPWGRLDMDFFDWPHDEAMHYPQRLRSSMLFEDHPYGPLSILHCARQSYGHGHGHDIYIAGRFPNILYYDRRKFPTLLDSIHSGARLSSLTAVPYAFGSLALGSDLRQAGRVSLHAAQSTKTTQAQVGGSTLIAGGEYNSKGSLELYGLRATGKGGRGHAWMFQNRQTCSNCKLLSVTTQGTRIATADGDGLVKWFERDGFTEVRRCRIGSSGDEEEEVNRGDDGGEMGMATTTATATSGELARKLVPMHQPTSESGGQSRAINDNPLVFWTGETLGLVAFSAKPGTRSGDFDSDDRRRWRQRAAGEAGDIDEDEGGEEDMEEKARMYRQTMRQALERQANDVRFVQDLGLGSAAVW